MVTGSPRSLSMPEVTDIPSALIQARKPTKEMLSSIEVQGGASPAHHSQSYHQRESMRPAERGTLKWSSSKSKRLARVLSSNIVSDGAHAVSSRAKSKHLLQGMQVRSPGRDLT
ncbi:unnamed protein product [Pleuronectes platessa]|uniref:Uncharacterized protein n=1 Tax=Pleuronectes platessa TaxID=8262 RepID=A0A9N7YHH3_PLEPL|nr:unnamed protein product [Pleuronectes platessa]